MTVNVNRQRARLLDRIAQSAPNHQYATYALQHFPTAHPLAEHCWPWRFGKSGGRPVAQLRPDVPRHPIHYFFGERIKNHCGHVGCVNPWHFTQATRPATVNEDEDTLDAEELIEEKQPKTWAEALELDPALPKRAFVIAYRNLYHAMVIGPQWDKRRRT
jgi:hypothetical protein